MLRQINHWLTVQGGLGKIPSLLSLLFGVSKYYRQDLRALSKSISNLITKNGNGFAVAYLKECVRLTYLRLGGEGSKVSKGPPFVALSGGLPVIIPGRLRGMLRQSHPALTVSVLTLLGIYRGLICPPKYKLETITAGFTGSVDPMVRFSNFVPSFVAQLQLPSLGRIRLWLSTSVGPHGLLGSVSAIRDAAALLRSDEGRAIFKQLRSYVEGLHGYRDWTVLNFQIRFFSAVHRVLFPSWAPVSGETSWLSRLHRIEEAAGKVRVVAIVDYWTQTALRPLHSMIFRLLRELSQDGTFDQDACVTRLREIALAKLGDQSEESNFTAYSFDLSAATDRIPVHMYLVLLTELFSRVTTHRVAYHLVGLKYLCYLVVRKLLRPWKNKDVRETLRVLDSQNDPVRNAVLATRWKNLLTYRKWWDRDSTWTPEEGLKPEGAWLPRLYAVGQPMGAYSSWACLALVHHAIVQLASAECGLKGWFDEYGIVGDDVVILNSSVAERYHSIVTDLGIEISMDKSIVSRRGVFEFCKRLVAPTGDLSGISIGLIHQAFTHPLDSASLFRHLLVRDNSLFPIAVVRTVAFLLGVSPRYDVPFRKLQVGIRMVLTMLVQPGFPWWRGIFLMHQLPSLTIEQLEELLRTGAKTPSDEFGMYGHLEELSLSGYLANLNPVNWIQALSTVPEGVTKWLRRALRPALPAWSLDKVIQRVLLLGTPLGWWLMGRTISRLSVLFGYFISALRETLGVPFLKTLLERLIFLRKRVRDRVLEDHRGNSKDYVTVLAKARGRGDFDLSFGSTLAAERKRRRRLAWPVQSLRSFKPSLPPGEVDWTGVSDEADPP